MKEKQKQMLLKLADHIEQNPEEYRQGSRFRCVIGLGIRAIFYKDGTVKLKKPSLIDGVIDKFSKRYGVPYGTASDIWVNNFGNVHKNFKNTVYKRRASSAAKLLRRLAESGA